MKKTFAAALPITFPLLLTFLNSPTKAALRPPTLRVSYSALAESGAALPEHSVLLSFDEDDTLDGVLQSGGLTRKESTKLTGEFARFVDVRRLRPGHLLRFHHDASGSIDSVEMKVRGWGEIHAMRSGSGFDVTAFPATPREIESVVTANIDRSLYEAVCGVGESPQLVEQLVDIFQWDIDFFALQRGDSFSLVVKKRFAGSEMTGYGSIMAAVFTHDGDTFEAFRHEGADGHAGYYSRSGTPLRKQFLRAPLPFTRITSHFSRSRFHPLLHYFRPHNGVDYGAPVGTPVMTTADGVIAETGYRGGEGRFIRVRHTSRIETMYLHLSRYAGGIRPGKKVVQGDVIGYVGATGLATGPHLDYRVRDSGKWLDPLTLKSITPDPLRGDAIAQFRAQVARLAPRLNVATTAVASNLAKRRALF